MSTHDLPDGLPTVLTQPDWTQETARFFEIENPPKRVRGPRAALRLTLHWSNVSLYAVYAEVALIAHSEILLNTRALHLCNFIL